MQKMLTSDTLPITSFLLAIGVASIWGINFVMVKIGLEQIPPLTLCMLRFLLASVPAIFFIKPPQAAWKYIIGYGLLTFALQFSLLFAGMASGVSAGISSLILQLQVFFSIGLAYFFIKETISFWKIMGACIAFFGIGIIAWHHHVDCSLLGLLLLISSAMAWSTGNLISVKLKNVNMLSLVVWGSFIAFFPLLLLSSILEKPYQTILYLPELPNTSLMALFYIVYISTHVGYGCWSWLLSRHPTSSIAPFACISSITGLAASAWILDESFESWKIIASILVITGVLLSMFGKRAWKWSITSLLRFQQKLLSN